MALPSALYYYDPAPIPGDGMWMISSEPDALPLPPPPPSQKHLGTIVQPIPLYDNSGDSDVELLPYALPPPPPPPRRRLEQPRTRIILAPDSQPEDEPITIQQQQQQQQQQPVASTSRLPSIEAPSLDFDPSATEHSDLELDQPVPSTSALPSPAGISDTFMRLTASHIDTIMKPLALEELGRASEGTKLYLQGDPMNIARDVVSRLEPGAPPVLSMLHAGKLPSDTVLSALSSVPDLADRSTRGIYLGDHTASQQDGGNSATDRSARLLYGGSGISRSRDGRSAGVYKRVMYNHLSEKYRENNTSRHYREVYGKPGRDRIANSPLPAQPDREHYWVLATLREQDDEMMCCILECFVITFAHICIGGDYQSWLARAGINSPALAFRGLNILHGMELISSGGAALTVQRTEGAYVMHEQRRARNAAKLMATEFKLSLTVLATTVQFNLGHPKPGAKKAQGTLRLAHITKLFGVKLLTGTKNKISCTATFELLDPAGANFLVHLKMSLPYHAGQKHLVLDTRKIGDGTGWAKKSMEIAKQWVKDSLSVGIA